MFHRIYLYFKIKEYFEFEYNKEFVFASLTSMGKTKELKIKKLINNRYYSFIFNLRELDITFYRLLVDLETYKLNLECYKKADMELENEYYVLSYSIINRLAKNKNVEEVA